MGGIRLRMQKHSEVKNKPKQNSNYFSGIKIAYWFFFCLPAAYE